METLPVEWETFVARRKLNVKDWLSSNDIKHYSALVNHLQKRGIAPPALTTVEKYFKKPKKAKKPKSVPLTTETQAATAPQEPAAPKKRGRRKKVHNEQSG